MPTSTAQTYLFYKPTSGATAEKLLDITSYPDLGSTPSKIDVTDLSAEKFRKSILGLQDVPDLTFEANYEPDVFKKIDALTGNYDFELQFGVNGADGKFTWNGEIKIFMMGGGVDEARKMQVTLSAETEITHVAP